MFCINCGKEVSDEAFACMNCGAKLKDERMTPVDNTGNKLGWGFLGAFCPLVGLILYLSWKSMKPVKAKAAGVGAIIGVCSTLAINILTYIIRLCYVLVYIN